MAAKKSGGALRGASLVKKAIAANAVAEPQAVPAGILKKLRLPNDEKLPAGLKAFLAYDASSFGWEFDDEEPEFEPMSFEEFVAQEFGDEAVPNFGSAVEILDGDCIPIEGDEGARAFLYVGTPDDDGEYPVIFVGNEPAPWVAGFVPFDVFVAQRCGVLPAGDKPGAVPEEYVAAAQALAESNGDGRREFAPEHREIASGDDGDDDEDEDEDEEEDEG
jgi:hypothetical protein